MALQSIGGSSAASALEKFQAIRDSAKKRMDGADTRVRLTDLVQQKQVQLGLVKDVPGMSAAYGRGAVSEKSDPQPRLGRYIDFKA